MPTLDIPLAAALLASPLATAGAGSFVADELYLVSSGVPNPAGSPAFGSGVLHIDPLTGASDVVAMLPLGLWGPAAFLDHRSATYDPARDRIVIHLVTTSDLVTVRADGSHALIDVAWDAVPFRLAPDGQGRIFMSSGTKLGYLDAQDMVHDLLDVDGITPLTFPEINSTRAMIFDAASNSLIVAAALPAFQTTFYRFPLSADRTQAVAPPVKVVHDLAPSTSEIVEGLSRGPEGTIFIGVDVNSNGNQPLLQLLEPQTLAVSIFSTCNYSFTAAQTGGTWSSLLGKGLAADHSNQVVRMWSEGQGGAGTVLATGTGVGDSVRLLAIGETVAGTDVSVPTPGDLDGDGDVDGADLGLLLGAWGPCADCAACPGDLDGDCQVDGADLGLLLGAWT